MQIKVIKKTESNTTTDDLSDLIEKRLNLNQDLVELNTKRSLIVGFDQYNEIFVIDTSTGVTYNFILQDLSDSLYIAPRLKYFKKYIEIKSIHYIDSDQLIFEI